jgi:hypothetical protein
MELKLVRDTFTDVSTIGKLYVDGKFECFTLEDPVQTGPKIPGNTCIPYGKFRVILTVSPRFKRVMPRLVDVPEFDGVLIHYGNTASDTAGCILVGTLEEKDLILRSRIAFSALFDKLEASKEPISIEITK